MGARLASAVPGMPSAPGSLSARAADLERRIDEACGAIAARVQPSPRVAVVLGSGLGGVVELLETAGRTTIPYADIPHVPETSVGGHAGELVAGTAAGISTAILSGRSHQYEGHSPQDVTLLVRALFSLGLETLVVTNSAGALNPSFEPGEPMLMTDMINLSGDNPLRGPNLDRFGPRFPSMTDPFDRSLRHAARRAAEAAGVALREGVYVMLAGPSYETRAEMRMLRLLGADAVGMSTVPEVIVARHAGVRVVGFSVITNKEPPDEDPGVSHEEVLEVGRLGADRLVAVLRGLLPELG